MLRLTFCLVLEEVYRLGKSTFAIVFAEPLLIPLE